MSPFVLQLIQFAAVALGGYLVRHFGVADGGINPLLKVLLDGIAQAKKLEEAKALASDLHAHAQALPAAPGVKP